MDNIRTQSAPSRDYIEMTLVKETATGRGINSKIIMEAQPDGMFKVTDGRIGIQVGRHKPKVYVRPMADWEDFFSYRSRNGYLVTKTKKTEQKIITKGNGYAPIEDPGVKEIVQRLQDLANTAMEENYTVRVDDISEEMIKYGTDVLNALADGYQKMSVAEFNQKLRVLYAAVPRRIDKLSDKLAKTKSDMQNIVANEQELFDNMVFMVKNAGVTVSADKTILDTMGLEWRPVTDEEETWIKKRMGRNGERYVKAWRIKNQATEKRFDDFCKKENLTEPDGISHLFHGSRTENWWSIVTNGLTINPKGVVITGKAYGYGTYFAPSAQKSLGYTTMIGAKWTNGSDATGFLSLYKVATGKRYDGSHGINHSLNWNVLQEICPGAHCTWAESRYSGFMMDEVIVYQDCQDTIEYLIEVKA